MATLMLVNPKPRGKKKMAYKKRRTAAQKRATAKLVALNKRRARGKVRRNPAKRKAVARKRVAVTAPSRRTGRKPTARLTARRKRNTKQGYFPNPARRKNMVQNIIDKQLIPAATQASGALLLDVGYGYFGSFIPPALNTGMIRHATKGAIAIGLGFLAGNFVRQKVANEMAMGALTVTMRDAMKEALQTFMPAIPVDGVGYYNVSPVVYANGNNNNGMGYFESNTGEGYAPHALGYFSQDTGQGYATVQPRAESELFDTSDI